MKAIIMAAGLGTRLRPLTERIPKALVEINGKPLLAYHLEALSRLGVKDLVINSHYLADQIDAFVSHNNFGINVSMSFESELLGSAGTLRRHSDFLGTDDFLVVYGDNLTNIDYQRLISYHKGKGGLATMACYFESNPAEKGIVELDEDNRIVNMIEKPGFGTPASWANGGIYVFKSEILKLLTETLIIPFDLAKDFMQQSFFTKYRVYAYQMNEYLRDIGELESLAKAQVEVKDIKF